MNTIIQLLTNSAILSLGAGFILGVYNLLKMPTPVSNFISLYLIFCIGLKGGMCLGVTNACTPPLIMLALCGLALGFIQPFFNFFILNRVTNLDRQTAVVVAAQYGSISIVTFITAITFLQQNGIAYDTFMSAIAGGMEVPALFSGLLILKSTQTNSTSLLHSFIRILYEIITTKKISFIFLGFFVGFLLRDYQTQITSTVLWPFNIMLILFMLNIGTKIAQQRAYIHQFTWSLIAFGIYVPIISGLIGILICSLLGIQLGTTLLFAVLVGSASYIAIPAVMHTQAPQAKAVIYLPLALAITLPFNLIFGIPFFYTVAKYVL